MYLADYGDVYEYADKKYIIGEIVIGTKGSIYEGLPGVLMEIRDGSDKETDNPMPDLYGSNRCIGCDPYRLWGDKERLS